MGLPVSAPAVRKRALNGQWAKVSHRKETEIHKAAKARQERRGFGSDRNVSGNHENHDKVSENHHEKPSGQKTEKHDQSQIVSVHSDGPGRPTLYRDEFPTQAFKLCLLGYVDEQLAEFFLVSVSTINLWKLKHPEFSESIRNGKAIADSDVATGLYQRATGYSHDDVHIAVSMGTVIVTNITKYYPPDVTAQRYWLKNRQPRLWKDKVEIVAEVGVNAFPSDEVLDALFKQSQERSKQNAQEHLSRDGRLGLIIDQDEQDG
jgi:hypothetical protein